ncbi:hypothetical protein NX059_000706 [Plenodomus lindquistii]|nr:hypothetical protein NX059_000706 [Plenodomus lindquistii]
MPSQRRLTLAGVEEYAERKFPKAFTKFEAMREFTFERKKAANGHPRERAEMLLVGRYHTQNATLPNVWAYTVGSGISYYVSLRGTLLAKLAPDPARIYFCDEPFSLMIGAKNDEVLYTAKHARSGYVPSINKWRDVVESAITYIFLKSGRMDYAYVSDKRDMLDNFRLACMYFKKNTRSGWNDYRIKQEESDLDCASDTSRSQGSDRRGNSYEDTKVKTESDDSDSDEDSGQHGNSHSHGSVLSLVRHMVGKSIKRGAARTSQKYRTTSKSKTAMKVESEDESTSDANIDHEMQALRKDLKQEKRKVRKMSKQARELKRLKAECAKLRKSNTSISRKYKKALSVLDYDQRDELSAQSDTEDDSCLESDVDKDMASDDTESD